MSDEAKDLRLKPGVHKVQVNTLQPGDVMWFKHYAAVVKSVSHENGSLHVRLADGTVRRYRTASHVNATRKPAAVAS